MTKFERILISFMLLSMIGLALFLYQNMNRPVIVNTTCSGCPIHSEIDSTVVSSKTPIQPILQDTLQEGYMWITPDVDIDIDHFYASEFVSKCSDITKTKLDVRLLPLMEFIRKRYNTTIVIRSTERSKACNDLIPGAEKSQHLHGRAIDFKFISNGEVNLNAANLFIRDIEEEGLTYKYLRELGLAGVGKYSSGSIHVDVKPIKITDKLRKWGTDPGAYTGDICKL